jgi:hypothetical protein
VCVDIVYQTKRIELKAPNSKVSLFSKRNELSFIKPLNATDLFKEIHKYAHVVKLPHVQKKDTKANPSTKHVGIFTGN